MKSSINPPVTFGSVCSGIEAASCAWLPLGWKATWLSEIEPFPSAVLAYRHPDTPNLGDMTTIASRIASGDVNAPDVLVGGTPCQAFSIAGLRGGLDDERGALTLKYVELANAIDEKRLESGHQPAINVWENVPGVLTSEDNAFGCFLAGLAGEDEQFEPGDRPELGKSNPFWRWNAKTRRHVAKWPQSGCIVGPQRKVAWRVIDAQYVGVAQRRRRVFVVASARTDIDTAKILLEFDGVRRDIAPSRLKGEIASALTGNGVGVRGADDNQAQAGHLIAVMAHGQAGAEIRIDNSAPTLTCNHESPIVFSSTGAGCWSEGAGTLRAREQESHEHLAIMAFPQNMSGTQYAASDDICPSLMAHNPTAIARGGIRLQGGDGQIIGAISCSGGKPGQGYPAIIQNSSVRRLTPIECERLQGFPDNWTLIPASKRKKITADELAYIRHHSPDISDEDACKLAADGPRYKVLGNSMAVPVMRWIGERIADAITNATPTEDKNPIASEAHFTLHHGNCLDVLKTLPANSIDSIVCDPPYGISFMGKKWDYDVPNQAIWEACLRVLKPGGHLLAFASTRTQHRMAVRIEDAGFEIRDMIAWMYGSGFPKSTDVNKAINKAAGGDSNDCDESQWQGWGTALKPAVEPITVARKPFKGTVAGNVLEHGTGALNIDACRVPLNGDYKSKANGRPSQTGLDDGYQPEKANIPDTLGRWPANLIHDGSDEVLEIFPANAGAAAPVKGTEPSSASTGNATGERERVEGVFHGDKGSAARFFYCAKASRKDRNEGLDYPGPQFTHGSTLRKVQNTETRGNHHPTVKPTDLMAYLCRLVTPPGGVVLDPFVGSGSTGKAAMREGFRFIGIELDNEYHAIAEKRVAYEAQNYPRLPRSPEEYERPIFKWLGGKFSVLPIISEHLPHGKRLIEPFVGGGSVFTNAGYQECLLNDVNSDLINFYQVLLREGHTLIALAHHYFQDNNTPEAFLKIRKKFNEGQYDDLHHAAAFLYLNRHCFNGLIRYNLKGEFNVGFGKYKAPYFPHVEMEGLLGESEKCKFVCGDFSGVIHLAGAGDVIFCDPPYEPLPDTNGFTNYSGHDFPFEEQERLVSLLVAAHKRGAKVLITNSSAPNIRELYLANGFSLHQLPARRSVSCNGDTRTIANDILAKLGC